MGFGLIIWDTKQQNSLRDERWTGSKWVSADEFFQLICEHCTDIERKDMHMPGDGELEFVRPANKAEAEAVRAVLRTWPAEHNRDLFLHAVDVVANNPALRFVPSY